MVAFFFFSFRGLFIIYIYIKNKKMFFFVFYVSLFFIKFLLVLYDFCLFCLFCFPFFVLLFHEVSLSLPSSNACDFLAYLGIWRKLVMIYLVLLFVKEAFLKVFFLRIIVDFCLGV